MGFLQSLSCKFINKCNSQKEAPVQPVFYKIIKYITIIVAFALIYVLVDIGDYFNNRENFITDLRNVIIAILTGLIFSFLLTIQSIREFLLKSIANYMTDNSYIKKLSQAELKKLKENVMNEIHGTDIVSNKESLFNYLEKLDRFHIVPHKSIVNEKWIFENFSNDKFKLIRVQDYRIHSLNHGSHSHFDLKIRSTVTTSSSAIKDLLESIRIVIKVDAEIPIVIENILEKVEKEDLENFMNVSKQNVREMHIDLSIEKKNAKGILQPSFMKIKYEEDMKQLSFDYEYDVILEKEFTQVHILTERLEEIAFSQAILSSHAAYGLNYDVTLPEGYIFEDVYHNNTLDLKDELVNVHKRHKELAVNINGWQLPGLIFVYTYKRFNENAIDRSEV